MTQDMDRVRAIFDDGGGEMTLRELAERCMSAGLFNREWLAAWDGREWGRDEQGDVPGEIEEGPLAEVDLTEISPAQFCREDACKLALLACDHTGLSHALPTRPQRPGLGPAWKRRDRLSQREAEDYTAALREKLGRSCQSLQALLSHMAEAFPEAEEATTALRGELLQDEERLGFARVQDAES